jgi:D-glycero-alpha-D-manno-heptose-7-phosphate kinase
MSLFSGGSDMSSFYEKEKGAALSVTIDKFVYVCVHRTPHLGIKAMYDKIEETPDVETMQHEISKEAFTYFNYKKEITVASISDILSKGSGLGSSSTFTVGLVNALATLRWGHITKQYLADVACEIEIDRCGYPIGKQDQYAAAYGGMNLFEFHPDNTVSHTPINLNDQKMFELNQNLLLVYSGRGRAANSILQKQRDSLADKSKFDKVRANRDKAYQAYNSILHGQFDDIGHLFHEGWQTKKTIVESISNDYFDSVYNKAIEAGALGGKLLGAGGGGFFIFYVKKDKRSDVMSAVTEGTECKIYDFQFYEKGSEVVTNC